jgi:hypothetical protein
MIRAAAPPSEASVVGFRSIVKAEQLASFPEPARHVSDEFVLQVESRYNRGSVNSTRALVPNTDKSCLIRDRCEHVRI